VERPALLLGVIVFGAFVTALTGSVVGLALPDIARELRLEATEAAWVQLAFLLAVTVLLLPAGRLGDVVGHGRVYSAGMLAFGVASLVCSVAADAPVLLMARAGQGIAASLVMATSPALVASAMGSSRRGFALGLMSTGTYVGLALGPPLGGALVGAWGWRAVFWATTAAAVASFGLGLGAMPGSRRAPKSVRFDPLGALLLALTTLLFLLAATRGTAWGWSSAYTWLTLAAALGSLLWVVRVESRHPAPTLDFSLFRSAVFSSATAAALLNYVSLFIVLFMLPFAFRDGQHLAPAQVGLVLGAQAASMALLSGASGVLSDRIGSRGLAVGGMLVLGVSLGCLAWAWPTQGMFVPALWLFACGAGTGVFITPNSSALMGSAPRHQQGIAGGVMGLARNFGMSLGVAIGSALLGSALDHSTTGGWPARADRALATGLAISAGLALLAAWVVAAGSPRQLSKNSAPK
jgi:EmrB/QacA subfamily drug resistance transporter